MDSQVEQFFNPDGSLISIPVKNSKKIAVLQIIAANLDSSIRYTEKELNIQITKFYPDTAAIRRHMIEFGILQRDSSSIYWLSANS
jgi:hypothetical protein